MRPQREDSKIQTFTSDDVYMAGQSFAVRDALAQVLAGLDPLDLHEEDAAAIELVLAEVLNNIVEHAYSATPSKTKVQIKCELDADELSFTIHDWGLPMLDGQTPIGALPDNETDMDDLPEGGFGWYIIKRLTREISYKRDGDKNCLTLRIAIDGKRPALA